MAEGGLDDVLSNFDSWRRVIACLADCSPPSVASLSATCSALRLLCSEDSVWRRCCQHWWREHYDECAGEGASSSARRRVASSPPDGWPLAALKLPSHHAAYTALELLGLNPVGLWVCTNDPPTGHLVRVECADGQIRGSVVRVDEIELRRMNLNPDGSLGGSIPWRTDREAFRIEFAVDTAPSTSATSPRRPPASLPVLRVTVPSEGERECSATMQVTGRDEFTLLTQKPRAESTSRLVDVAGVFSNLLGIQSMTVKRCYRRVALPLSSPETLRGLGVADEQLATLQQLCGLWAAPYGAHGMEFLKVSLQRKEHAVGAEGLIGCELSGRKMTGDPNVPALELSFIADLQSPVPREELLADPRPLISFPVSGPMIVDLTRRRIVGIYRAKGQINRIPGLWEPEWVGAHLLVYREGWFSVLWQDIGEQWKHIIDYSTLSIPCDWATDPV